jgi:uncharacterized membrane protein
MIVTAKRKVIWIHVRWRSVRAKRTALVCYWANILLLGAVLYAGWRYAQRAGLATPDTSREIACAIERRIIVAQVLYAAGALLCLVNTYASIGFIVLVQLHFAIAPRLGFLSRF